jgi:hypothetical protein
LRASCRASLLHLHRFRWGEGADEKGYFAAEPLLLQEAPAADELEQVLKALLGRHRSRLPWIMAAIAVTSASETG